jgi:archaea-specific RecJ-like exonuclease
MGKNQQQNKHKQKGNFKPRFKKDNFSRDKFDKPRFEKPSFEKTEELDISKINLDFSKKTLAVKGAVDKIVQTGGPTIFVISDGTGSLSLKGFEKAGERAYPEIQEGETIKAIIKIDEYQGELEGNIEKISKLSAEENETLLKEILRIEKERAKINPKPFLVKSHVLDKLRDRFIKAAEEIRLAIIQKRPIIVRHHNDTDGYSAGFALEKAILPLIAKEQTSEKAGWEYFLRAPCAAPFYEIDDSIRDTALSLRNVAKFSNKMPLVIIADNGSSPEDLLAIEHGKVHGMQFIVVDHHYSDEDVISKEVLVHINPFLVKEDGAKFSAGMLCTELAKLINPETKNIDQIPAMAGLADRIDLGDPVIVKNYLEIAKKEGYSKELLHNISTVIDFVSAKIRFMEVREYIETIFGEPREKQKKLVELLAPYIKNLEKKGLAIGKSNAKTEKIGKITLQTIDIDETFPGFGFYPKPGMSVGMVHDDLQKTDKVTSLVSIGIMRTAITIRATDKANFSVHELITYLNEKLPNAFVEGGGHKNAGSITFIPNKQEEILTHFREFVKSR